MANHNTYKMELPAYVRIRNKLGSAPRCRLCGHKIEVGDEVVSNRVAGNRVNYYIYHAKCYSLKL